MTTMITYTPDPAVAELRFADAPVVYEFPGEVLADVNRMGNWIRGLELLGSGLQFSLERALTALIRKSSSVSLHRSQNKFAVTYDEDANAGFLYLPYASSDTIAQDQQSNPLLLKSSYTIGDDTATFGLAADKKLVFIRFKIPATEQPATFMRLFDWRGDTALL